MLDRKTTGFVLAAAVAALVPLRAPAAPSRSAEGTTAHVHAQQGVACVACHGAARKPAPVGADRCLSCHGPYDRVVEQTSKLRPLNPHASPHWGADIECAVCHRQHEPTVNWCAHCHTVANVVP